METIPNSGYLTQLLETGEDGIKHRMDRMEKNTITIGSDLNCDIRCLNLPVQKYCEFSYNVNNKAIIRMLTITNVDFPVLLNSITSVDKEEVVLNDGDILTIGDMKMKWEYKLKRPEFRRTITTLSTPINKSQHVINDEPKSDNILMHKNIQRHENTKADHGLSKVPLTSTKQKRDISMLGSHSTSKIPVKRFIFSDKKCNSSILSHTQHSVSKIPIAKSHMSCSKELKMHWADMLGDAEKYEGNHDRKTLILGNTPKPSTPVKNAPVKTPGEKSTEVRINRHIGCFAHSNESNSKHVTPKHHSKVHRSSSAHRHILPGRVKSAPSYGEWEDKMCSPLPGTPTVEWKLRTLADFPKLPLPKGTIVDLTNGDEQNISCIKSANDITVNSILFSPSQRLSLTKPQVAHFDLGNKSPEVYTNQSVAFTTSGSKKSEGTKCEVTIDEQSVSKCKRNLMEYISPCAGAASFTSPANEEPISDDKNLDSREINVCSVKEFNETIIETSNHPRKSTPFKPFSKKRSLKDSYKFSPVENEDKSFNEEVIDERFKHVTRRERGKRRKSSYVEEENGKTFINDWRKSYQNLSLIEESPADSLNLKNSDTEEESILNTTYDIEENEETLNSTFVIEPNDQYSPKPPITNTAKKLVSILTPAAGPKHGAKKKSVCFAIPSTPENNNRCHDTLLLAAFQTPSIETDLFVSPLDNEVTKMAGNDVLRQSLDVLISKDVMNMRDGERSKQSLNELIGADVTKQADIELSRRRFIEPSSADVTKIEGSELSRRSFNEPISADVTKMEYSELSRQSFISLIGDENASCSVTNNPEKMESSGSEKLESSRVVGNEFSINKLEEQALEHVVKSKNEYANLKAIEPRFMIKKEITETEKPSLKLKEGKEREKKHRDHKRKKIWLKKHRRMGYPTNESGIYYLEPPSFLIASARAKCIPHIKKVAHDHEQFNEIMETSKVNSEIDYKVPENSTVDGQGSENSPVDCQVSENSPVECQVPENYSQMNNSKQNLTLGYGNNTQKTEEELLCTPPLEANPHIRCTSRSSAVRKQSRSFRSIEKNLSKMEDSVLVNDSSNDTPTLNNRSDILLVKKSLPVNEVSNLSIEGKVTENDSTTVNESRIIPEIKIEEVMEDDASLKNDEAIGCSTASENVDIESSLINESKIMNENDLISSLTMDEEVTTTLPSKASVTIDLSTSKEISQTEEVIKEASTSPRKEEDTIENRMETPCEENKKASSPRFQDLRGIKELFKTPKPSSMSYTDLRGVRELMKTPSSPRATYTALTGMKRMFAEHKEPTCSYENVSGVKRILHPPKTPDYSSVEGMNELLMSPLCTPLKTIDSIKLKADSEEELGNMELPTCEGSNGSIHVIQESAESIMVDVIENVQFTEDEEQLETVANGELINVTEQEEKLERGIEEEKVCDTSSKSDLKPDSLEIRSVEGAVVTDEPVRICLEEENPIDATEIEREQQIGITKSPIEELEPIAITLESLESRKSSTDGVADAGHATTTDECKVMVDEDSKEDAEEVKDEVLIELSQSEKTASTTKSRTRKNKRATCVEVGKSTNGNMKSATNELMNLPAELKPENITDHSVSASLPIFPSPPALRSKLRSAKKSEAIHMELKDFIVELPNNVPSKSKEKVNSSSSLDAHDEPVRQKRVMKKTVRSAKKKINSGNVEEPGNLISESTGNVNIQLPSPAIVPLPKSDVERVQDGNEKLMNVGEKNKEKSIVDPSLDILVTDTPAVKRVRLPRSAKKSNEIIENVQESTKVTRGAKRRLNSKINESSSSQNEVAMSSKKPNQPTTSANAANNSINLPREYEERIGDLSNQDTIQQPTKPKTKKKRLSVKVTRNSCTRELRARRKRSSSIIARKKVTFNPFKQVRIMTPRVNSRKPSTAKNQPQDSIVKITPRRKSTARKSLDNTNNAVDIKNRLKRKSKTKDELPNSEPVVETTSVSLKNSPNAKANKQKTPSSSTKNPIKKVLENIEVDSPKRITRRTKNISGSGLDLDNITKNEIKIEVKVTEDNTAGFSEEMIAKKDNTKKSVKTHLKDIQPTDVVEAGPSGLTRDSLKNLRIRKSTSREINNNVKSIRKGSKDEDKGKDEVEPLKRVTRKTNKKLSLEGKLKSKKVDKNENRKNGIDKNAFDQNKENVMVGSSAQSMITSPPVLRRSERNKRRN